jgi:NADH:ubiquinone oxidoreductase subunit F (NADH-binding)
MGKVLSTVVIGLSLFMASCDTCTTCTYETKDNEEITEDFCGNSKDTEEFISTIEDSANFNRTKFTCSENH